VDRGEVVARIDHSLLDFRLEGARSAAEQTDAQLNLLLEGARSEDILQAEAALDQAEEQLELAREDFRRMQKLFDTGSVTEKQRDEAESRLKMAEAGHESALQRLRKLQSLARPEEVRAARAKLTQAQSQVRILEKQIADCTVTAPLGGTVTHRLAEPGEMVVQGTPLVTITDLRRVYLLIYLSEVEVGRVRLGQEAEVFIDSRPDRGFTGRITYISSRAEFTPKNVQTREERVKLVFAVKISVDNPEGILKPGLPGDAFIEPLDGESSPAARDGGARG